MIVEPLLPVHMSMIAMQGNLQAEQMLVAEHMTPENALLFIASGPAYAALHNGRVIGMAGVIEQTTWRSEAWAVLTGDARLHMVPVTRAIMRFLAGHKVRRIETAVRKGFPMGVRWAGILGFKYEGDMTGWGYEGATYERFAMVRDLG